MHLPIVFKFDTIVRSDTSETEEFWASTSGQIQYGWQQVKVQSATHWQSRIALVTNEARFVNLKHWLHSQCTMSSQNVV